ncbi:MMPL family protein, partial [Burkholderia cenocepacia BC7]
RVRGGARAARVRHARIAPAGDRRHRHRRAGAARELALQRRQRGDHAPVQHRRGRTVGDRRDDRLRRRMPALPGDERDRTLRDEHARRGRRAVGDERGVAGQGVHRRVQRRQPALGRAAAFQRRTHAGRQRVRSRQRDEHRELQGDPGPDLHEEPRRHDHRAHRRRDQALRGRESDAERRVPARGRQRRRDGRDQRGGRRRGDRDAAVDLRRDRAALRAHVPLVARGAVHHRAAHARVDPVQRGDGAARHRAEGRDAAGDHARRGRRRRLRDLPVRAPAARPPPRRDAAGRVRRCDAPARHGGAVHGRHDVHRRRHVGVLRAEVPGRHGRAARVHVPREPVRRGVPAARARRVARRRACRAPPA